ncbi:MAG: hypothetical protein K2K41_01325 [Ruminiclostridium sp.]|nr:hypothetical protein [Ruminiclostridium sp.]
MIGLLEKTGVKAPSTYSEWLGCLDILKGTNVSASGVYEALVSGSFAGTDTILSALQKQIIESVNALLNNSSRRFTKNMNDSIAFNDLGSIDLLFDRLKKDVKISLFFESLDFLPREYREELSRSVRDQMQGFWNETVSFLYRQSLEHSNSDLEDALFLIKRKKLFNF